MTTKKDEKAATKILLDEILGAIDAENAMLTRCTLCKDMSEVQPWNSIKALYGSKVKWDKAVASMLNYTFTSKKPVSLFAKEILAAYLKNDPNLNRKGTYSEEFKGMVDELTSEDGNKRCPIFKKFISEDEKVKPLFRVIAPSSKSGDPGPRLAAVWELSNPALKALLLQMITEEEWDRQRNVCLKVYNDRKGGGTSPTSISIPTPAPSSTVSPVPTTGGGGETIKTPPPTYVGEEIQVKDNFDRDVDYAALYFGSDLTKYAVRSGLPYKLIKDINIFNINEHVPTMRESLRTYILDRVKTFSRRLDDRSDNSLVGRTQNVCEIYRCGNLFPLNQLFLLVDQRFSPDDNDKKFVALNKAFRRKLRILHDDNIKVYQTCAKEIKTVADERGLKVTQTLLQRLSATDVPPLDSSMKEDLQTFTSYISNISLSEAPKTHVGNNYEDDSWFETVWTAGT